MTDKPTFPHKVGWQAIGGAISQATRAAYHNLATQNGEGVDRLIVGSGAPFPGKIVMPDGKSALKADGVAMIMVVVPCGGKEDCAEFCQWMGGNIETLLDEADQMRQMQEAAEEDVKKAWPEKGEEKEDDSRDSVVPE